MSTVRVTLGVAALAVAGVAMAKGPLFEDGGQPSRDPYSHDSQLTTGRMEGFRRLYVDPATWPDSLVPTTPADGARQVLAIENGTSAWARVRIGDAEVGQIRPFDVARIHDVKPGTYEVSFELPNRQRWTETIATIP